MTHRTAGYSYLELVVALTIIAALVAIAIDRLLPLQADAERTALENTVGALRSALGIKVAGYLSHGDTAALHAIEGSNPMDFLSEQPKNYRGARSGVGAADIDAGQWYFNVDSQTLMYRVLHEQEFSGARVPYAHAKFKVELVFDDKNANQEFDPGADVISGVRLVAVTPYQWLNSQAQRRSIEK